MKKSDYIRKSIEKIKQELLSVGEDKLIIDETGNIDLLSPKTYIRFDIYIKENVFNLITIHFPVIPGGQVLYNTYKDSVFQPFSSISDILKEDEEFEYLISFLSGDE